jgi:hypothetical protein
MMRSVGLAFFVGLAAAVGTAIAPGMAHMLGWETTPPIPIADAASDAFLGALAALWIKKL